MANSNIYDIATDLMTLVNTIATEASHTLPTRQYITTGTPAYDCEAVIVSVSTISTGSSESPLGIRSGVGVPVQNDLLFTIHLLRDVCVLDQSGTPPDVSELNADASAIAEDGWVVFNGVQGKLYSGDFDVGVECSNITLGPASALQYSGGLGGWTINLTVVP